MEREFTAKEIVFVLSIAVLCALVLFAQTPYKDNLEVTGDKVDIFIYNIDGVLVGESHGWNTITDNGLDFYLAKAHDSSHTASNYAKYLAFVTTGTLTTSSTSTGGGEVTTGGLGKFAGTYVHNSNANINITGQVTATGSVTGITYVCLCYTSGASASGDLVAYYTISPTLNIGSGSTIYVYWQFTGSRAT